jgi:hypothetical protein
MYFAMHIISGLYASEKSFLVYNERMPEKPICPKCHVEARATDYFCYNCGSNLKPKPPDKTLTRQILVYLGSFLLPPFGIYWAVPYLKQKDAKSKLIGTAAIVITILAFIFVVIWTKNFVNSFNNQLQTQIDSFGYY